MSPKELFKNYMPIDTHIHTNDGSADSRATVWDWSEFLANNFPWVEALVVTNHSYMPGVYDSRIMSGQVVSNRYGEVSSQKVFSGLEVNVLRSGELDVKEPALSQCDWVLAAVHPLAVEYGEFGEIGDTAKNVENAFIKAIGTGSIDVLAHPVRAIAEDKLGEMDWGRIFEECVKKGVMVEININSDNPEWWLKKLIASECAITFGSDWHGIYHFRRYQPKGLDLEQVELWGKVAYGSRREYDSLKMQDRLEYNRLYTGHELPDELYEWFAGEIEKAVSLGLQMDSVFNFYGIDLLSKYISLSKQERREFISKNDWKK